MHIVCLGAGPAGLYFSILLKQAYPACRISVFEKSAADDTYGWGVVLSDQTLAALAAADEPTHASIKAALYHWEQIEIHYRGSCTRSGGHGFAGIGRARLLDILQQRARGLGVALHFNQAAGRPEDYPDADLIVAADGINSAVRQQYSDVFAPEVHLGSCRYLWLGARCRLDAFTFDFRATEWGWFTLHAYRYDAEWSTFIVEAPENVWRAAGLEQADPAASLAFCQSLFAARLGTARLEALSNHARGGEWLRFNRLVCRQWHHGRTVLLGDAAHTAHFSIGSGTKLAMEDAVALVDCLRAESDIPTALAAYQARREPEVLRLQSAARNRQEWFEHVARYTQLPTLQFCYSLLTGSQRLEHENLRQRDPAFIARVEAELAARSGVAATTPPLFTPFRVGTLQLPNRIVVSPMATYAATDGLPNDAHLNHLSELAQGGAGLVMCEATAVRADGRITPACTGLWNDAQQAAWSRIVATVHASSGAAIGLQLAHCGPKGATRPPREGADLPLAGDAWPLYAASAQSWAPGLQIPQAMDRTEMNAVSAAFAAATRRARAAGFDLLELHFAHGYLLSSFLSPLSNQRSDEYGGSLANRLRFPLEVLAAVRPLWPGPLAVRISAHDWAPGGNTGDDAVVIAAALKAGGVDLIDVSSGQTSKLARPVYGRMYQTPLADRIRNEVGIPVIAVGNITTYDQVNTIIAAGRADLCALGRPHLADPQWTRKAAGALNFPLNEPARAMP